MVPYFEHRFFNTYYYANIVTNILSKDIELLGFISNFFSNEGMIYHLARPFRKETAFHCFLQNIIGDFFEDDMDEYDQRNFRYAIYADLALAEFGMDDYSFSDFIESKNDIKYSDVEAYHDEIKLTGTLEELYERIASEVFYLLFNNRDVLLKFNAIVSDYMEVNLNDIKDANIKRLFTNKGTLKRVRIPEWCKRAVYFRDRGKCCKCKCDLSGILSLKSEKHFDHIVPLALRGLNDVSNLQLLCDSCNRAKCGNEIYTSDKYESWF